MLVLGGASARAQDMLPGGGGQRSAEPVRQTRPVDADTLEGAELDQRAFTSADLPVPIRRVAPDSELATRPGRPQGTVVLAVKIRKDGTAEEPRVMRSVSGLDRAAIDAVRNWTWKPGRQNGKAVDLEVAVPVRFVAWPDAGADWTAERRLALTLERDSRTAEAFDRFGLALRALPESAPHDTLDMLRRDVLRTRPRTAPPSSTPGPDVVPIEALIALERGDSTAKNAQSVDDWKRAIASYETALRWAPWHWPAYGRLAEAEWRAGERDAATAHLELYLLGDLPASERSKAQERLTRLRAVSDPGKH
jgi:protein TonB